MKSFFWWGYIEEKKRLLFHNVAFILLLSNAYNTYLSLVALFIYFPRTGWRNGYQHINGVRQMSPNFERGCFRSLRTNAPLSQEACNHSSTNLLVNCRTDCVIQYQTMNGEHRQTGLEFFLISATKKTVSCRLSAPLE